MNAIEKKINVKDMKESILEEHFDFKKLKSTIKNPPNSLNSVDSLGLKG